MIELLKVKKCDSDAELIMNWRNDPITLINSFRMEKYNLKEFKKMFYEKYFINQLPPLFALYNNEKVAFIGSMDTNNKDINEISINICPRFRNKKLSVPIIKEVLNYIKNNYQKIRKINAEIKYFNEASIKCFKK